MSARPGIAILAALLASPALAQQGPPGSPADQHSGLSAPLPDSTEAIDLGGDRITIGVGAAVVPSYIGSDTAIVVPGIAAQGQVSGFSFQTQGTSLSVDLVPSRPEPGWKLQLGPMINLRLDRNSLIKDNAVGALGKLKKAWEPGVWAGIQRTGVVTSPYDTFSIGASWQHDVGSAHDSFIVSPGVTYATPLSHRAYVSLSAGSDYVGKGFGRYYYDITPQSSAASGLPAYTGADRAGWKDWNLGLLAARAVTGDLTHGLGVFATVGYARLLGPYARSPIVDQAGSRDQWSGGIGLAYTFR